MGVWYEAVSTRESIGHYGSHSSARLVFHLLGICCVPVDGLQDECPAQVHFEGNKKNSKIISPHRIPHGEPACLQWVHNPSQNHQISMSKKWIAKSEDKRSREGWPRQFLHFISRSSGDAHGPQNPDQSISRRETCYKNQRRTAAVHSADSALIFSPLSAHTSTRCNTSLREKKCCPLSTGRQMEINRNRNPPAFKSSNAPWTSRTGAAEERTVAVGGMLRYSPFSWCQWWWWATNCGWQQPKNEKGYTMRSDGQNEENGKIWEWKKSKEEWKFSYCGSPKTKRCSWTLLIRPRRPHTDAGDASSTTLRCLGGK